MPRLGEEEGGRRGKETRPAARPSANSFMLTVYLAFSKPQWWGRVTENPTLQSGNLKRRDDQRPKRTQQRRRSQASGPPV